MVGSQCSSCQVPWQSRAWNFGDDFWSVLANSGRFCDQRATLCYRCTIYKPPWCYLERSMIFRGDFGRILAKLGRFCCQGATLWSWNPLLSPNNFTWDHLLKTKWLVANETSDGSLDRAEHDILGMALNVFLASSVAREPLCDLGISSWALTTLLRII